MVPAGVAAAGGVQYSSTWDVDDYDPNTPKITDPHANVPPPAAGDCDKTISDMDKNQDYPIDRTGEDLPGEVVCITGDVTVQGSLKLAEDVTYVLDGGDLTMNSSSSSISCTHCTIAMTDFDSSGADTGSIKLTGGTVHITAPLTGTYTGMALYQDGRATDDGSKGQNHINGGSNGAITGVVYIPNQSVLYNGGTGTTAACLQLVGKRVEFSGNSYMKVASKCPNTGIPPVVGGVRVRLVG